MGKRTQTLSQSFAKIDARLSRRIPPTVVIVQPGERKGCSFDTGHGFSRVSLVRAIQVKQYRAPLEGRGEKRERGEKKETYHRVAIIARSSCPTYFCPIHRTIRRAEGERKRRGITFSRRTESHSLSPPPIPIRVESFPVEKFHLVLPFSSGDRCPLASKGTDFNIRLELTSASN